MAIRTEPRVAIVHPWMPWYRVELFDRLRDALADEGVSLSVAHGSQPGFAPGRGDEASLAWAERLQERKLSVLGRTPTVRRLWQSALESDLLILEDGLRNADTWGYLAMRRQPDRLNAFWGHGRTLVKPHSRLERAIKRRLLRRADWWFAYTDGVREAMIAEGLPAERITAVGNTFDTVPLATAREGVDPAAVEEMRSRLGLTAGHTALFIGGLAATKNLGMLIAASRIAAAGDPAFRIVIAGEGPLRDEVAAAAASGDPVVPVGGVFDPQPKALLAAACDVMAMPGLVGLSAVDSLVLGLPAVAVAPWNHAPEFGYLRAEENAIVTQPRAKEFAEAMLGLLRDDALRSRLRSQCLADAGQHDLDGMVERFSAGIARALAAGPAGR